jgi:hypothetical protein
MQTCLFAKPLLSNGCCIFAYLMFVAQQQVYMPQYKMSQYNSVTLGLLFSIIIVAFLTAKLHYHQMQ